MNERQTTIWNELNTDPENINYRSVRYDNYPALAALLNNPVPGSTVMIPNPEPQGTITVPVVPTVDAIGSLLNSDEIKAISPAVFTETIALPGVDAAVAWPLITWVRKNRTREQMSVFEVVELIFDKGGENTVSLVGAMITVLVEAGMLQPATVPTLQAALSATQEIPDPMWEPEIVDEENSTDPIPAPITRLGIGRVSTVELQSLLNSPEVSWP